MKGLRSLFSSRRSRDVLEGDGKSGQEGAAVPVPRHGASAERSCAATTDPSKWQRLSHTGTALPHRRRVPSARASGGRGTVVVEAVELNLGNRRGHALSRLTESKSQHRLGASPRFHRARNPHCPALSSPLPPAVTPRVTGRSPRVVPAGQGPGWGCSTPFSQGGRGDDGQGVRQRGGGKKHDPPCRARPRWYLPGAAPLRPTRLALPPHIPFPCGNT